MLYIHIPYCNRKCLYCDFFSGGASVADWPRLRRALISELKMRHGELPEVIPSLYFGGGTPSLIPAEEFHSLMKGIRESLMAEGHRLADECEVTLEANPEDVDAERIKAWHESGVNRLSLGVQTFSDELLRSIGRRHTGEDAERALRILKSTFGNVSADLIFGLPGGSVATLESDLDRLIGIAPHHVSVYTLMYEEDTALTALRRAGRVEEVPDEEVERQYRRLTARLRESGYEHYEISNYAKPGYNSRHNTGYWLSRPYLGIGPAAHSYDGGYKRRANPADLFGYLRHFAPEKRDATPRDAAAPFYQTETLTEAERLEERIMLRLRTSAGLDLAAFAADFGQESYRSLLCRARHHIESGRLQLRSGHLSLSEEGILTADAVIVDLLP
ncbi:MAG: radical SAM family heme chaperone HemW [Muribaculaceae bacterium]|nr:radical SAM family heme chaperone HemW [Muribaculaceae bacterium]